MLNRANQQITANLQSHSYTEQSDKIFSVYCCNGTLKDKMIWTVRRWILSPYQSKRNILFAKFSRQKNVDVAESPP